MEDLSAEPTHIRFLRRLVTILTATMIIGITAIFVLLFIRVNGETPAQTGPLLPDQITLPEGVTAQAITAGQGWYAIVTQDNRILIYDQNTGDLRQTVEISN